MVIYVLDLLTRRTANYVAFAVLVYIELGVAAASSARRTNREREREARNADINISYSICAKVIRESVQSKQLKASGAAAPETFSFFETLLAEGGSRVVFRPADYPKGFSIKRNIRNDSRCGGIRAERRNG